MVEPPPALTAMIAFSNACFVMMRRGVSSCSTAWTAIWPAFCDHSRRRTCVAGAEEEPIGAMPMASPIVAIVLAVNMPPHEPAPGQASFSSSSRSASLIVPRATAPTASKTSWMLTSLPRNLPGMIVPP